jgi:hypothetical protein
MKITKQKAGNVMNTADFKIYLHTGTKPRGKEKRGRQNRKDRESQLPTNTADH